MSLEQDVRAQLDEWSLTESALGAAALDIAQRLDVGDIRPAAAAMLHGQLRGYLADLRKLAPEAESSDEVDDLQQQREKRRRAAGMA